MNEYERKKRKVFGWSIAVFVVIGAFTIRHMIMRGDFNFSENTGFVGDVIEETTDIATSTPQ